MRPFSIALAFLLGFVALTGAAFAQEADSGKAIESVRFPRPPLVERGKAETWFIRGYGVVSALFGLRTWGWWELTSRSTGDELASGEFDGGFSAGASLAGYYSLRSGIFHVGGGIAFTSGEWKRSQGSCCELFVEKTTLRQFFFGVNLKIGNRVAKRLWLGGGLDFGPIVHMTEEWEGSNNLVTDNTSDADLGVRLFPYFAADVMLFNSSGFKLGLAIALGVVFIPAISDIESSVSDTKFSQRHLTPMITIGPMLGS